MPLTEDQKAAVATLATADADAVAEALKNDANPIYNRVFRAGVSTGKESADAKTATLQEQYDAEKARAEKAEAELREAQAKTPDVEKLNRDWQAKLDATKAEAEAERAARKQEREARKIADLRAHLTGVDPEYARWKAGEHGARLRTKDDGTVELLEAGSEVPVQIPQGKTPFEVLAEEIIKATPAGLRVSNVDTGGGARGGGGSGGGNPYDEIRKKAEERQKQRAGNSAA